MALLRAEKERADAQAKLDIEQAEVDAEAAYINSSVNWGKAGGGMNAGFAAAMQNVANTNTRAIAKMKIDARYKSVELNQKIAEAQFNMTHKLNKIISDSNEAIITTRKNFIETKSKIDSSIILTKKEKVDKINEAKLNYINNKATIQDKMAEDMKKANDEIQK